MATRRRGPSLEVHARPADSYSPIRLPPPIGTNLLQDLGEGLQRVAPALANLAVQERREKQAEQDRAAQAAAESVPTSLLEGAGWADSRALVQSLVDDGFDRGQAEEMTQSIYFRQVLGRRVATTGNLPGFIREAQAELLDPANKESVGAIVDRRIQEWMSSQGLGTDMTTEETLGAVSAIEQVRSQLVGQYESQRKGKLEAEELKQTRSLLRTNLEEWVGASTPEEKAQAANDIVAQLQSRAGAGLDGNEEELHEAILDTAVNLALDTADEETALELYHSMRKAPLRFSPSPEGGKGVPLETSHVGKDGQLRLQAVGRIQQAARLAQQDDEKRLREVGQRGLLMLDQTMGLMHSDLQALREDDLVQVMDVNRGIGKRLYDDWTARMKESGVAADEGELRSIWQERMMRTVVSTYSGSDNDPEKQLELEERVTLDDITLEEAVRDYFPFVSSDTRRWAQSRLESRKSQNSGAAGYTSNLRRFYEQNVNVPGLGLLDERSSRAYQNEALTIIANYEQAADSMDPEAQKAAYESARSELLKLGGTIQSESLFYDFYGAYDQFVKDKVIAGAVQEASEFFARLEQAQDFEGMSPGQIGSLRAEVLEVAAATAAQLGPAFARPHWSNITQQGAHRQRPIEGLASRIDARIRAETIQRVEKKLKNRLVAGRLAGVGSSEDRQRYRVSFATPELRVPPTYQVHKLAHEGALSQAASAAPGSSMRPVPELVEAFTDLTEPSTPSFIKSLLPGIPEAKHTNLNKQILAASVALTDGYTLKGHLPYRESAFVLPAGVRDNPAATRGALQGLIATRGISPEELRNGRTRENVPLASLFPEGTGGLLSTISVLTPREAFEARQAGEDHWFIRWATQNNLDPEQVLTQQEALWRVRAESMAAAFDIPYSAAEKRLMKLRDEVEAAENDTNDKTFRIKVQELRNGR